MSQSIEQHQAFPGASEIASGEEIIEEHDTAIVEAHTATEPEGTAVENPDPLQPLTISTNNPLQTRNIAYLPMLPSYPQTDVLGFTYVLDVKEGKWEDSIEHQYCRKRICSSRPSRSGFLSDEKNGVAGQMIRYKCSGIKRCDYLDPNLRNVSHTQIDENELIQTSRLHEKYCDASDKDIKKRNASKKYFSINERFAKGKACNCQTNQCRPVLGQFQTASNIYGTFDHFVRCILYNPETPQMHFFQSFRASDQVDWPTMESYFTGLEIKQRTCYRIAPTSTRSENCGVPHPQGPGQWIIQECDVKFRIFVPNDLKQTPYVLFTSHGTHTHAAPPPLRTPIRYIEDFRRLIRMAGSEELSFVKFQTSSVLQEYLESHKVNTLGQLHTSLNNSGRIAWELHKQRMLLYPQGTQIAGVVFQFDQEKKGQIKNRFIQEMWNDADGLMIICFYTDAVRILQEETNLEVDMSFKRIRQSNLNEILIAKWLEAHNRVFTFARIIVSTDTTRTYKLAFQRFFNLVATRTGQPILWYYLHGSGYKAVIVDMLLKQASGLGQYLSELDPEHRPWQWQIKNIILYCTIHFDRSINKVAGTQFTESSGHFEMRSLKSASTEIQWYECIKVLMQHPNRKVRDWTTHKNLDILRCGLQPYFSLMDKEYFIRIRNHTNAVEVAANKGYASGIRMDLLPAIRKAAIRDFADLEALKASEQHQISTTWRSNSAVQRESRQIKNSQSISSTRRRSSPSIREGSIASLNPTSSQDSALMPPPASSTNFYTAIQSSRKRGPTLSSSSRSDTFQRRIADRTLDLQQQEQRLRLEAQALQNRQLQQQLDREALAFEKEQREFRRELEREGEKS